MARKVKDVIEIRECGSLNEFITQLTSVRVSLPPLTEAEVRMKGDDVRGRVLSIGYFRPQTADEAECEARYADAYRQSRERLQVGFLEELEFTALQPVRLRTARPSGNGGAKRAGSVRFHR